MNFSHETDAADLGDRVLNQIFACGLTIAGISGRPDISVEVARRLHDAVDELDIAVTEIRRFAFAALVADPEPPPNALEPDAPDAIAVAEPEPVVDIRAASNGERRRLRRTTDDGVFAYAMRGDFYRVVDHELWAHENEDLLLSARSGRPLARRTGNVFYGVETNVPLYYDDSYSGRVPFRSWGGSPTSTPGPCPSLTIIEEGAK